MVEDRFNHEKKEYYPIVTKNQDGSLRISYEDALKLNTIISKIDLRSLNSEQSQFICFLYDDIEKIEPNKTSTIKYKKISDDSWGRKRIQNIDNGNIYADVDGVWNTTSKDGEPSCPLKKTIELVEVKE